MSLETDDGDRISTILKTSDIKKIIESQDVSDEEKLTWTDNKIGLLTKYLMKLDESLSMDDVSYIKMDGSKLIK
jgi:hypothetical protein